MMTKTEELLKLADAATPGPWKSTVEVMRIVQARLSGSTSFESSSEVLGITCGDNNNSNAYFIVAANPVTIKQLVELCRLQHEALKKYEQRQSCDDLEYAGYAGESAIAAFERFEKGEG